MNGQRGLALLLSVFALGACEERADDAAAEAAGQASDKFASSHFLQYFNKQHSLAAGEYTLIAATASSGQAGPYTLTITRDDGSSETVTGAWTGSGQDPMHSGNPRHALTLTAPGGLKAALSAPVDAYLYLLDHAGEVLAQDDDSGPGSDALIDLPASHTNSAAYAQAYYATIDPLDARTTFAGWAQANGFDAGEDVHVIFRDTKDLGYGRNMHFRRNADGSLAFFVNNYVISKVPGETYGPLNLDAATAELAQYHIGTNAIEYGPVDSDGDGNPDDANGDGSVTPADFFPRFYNFSSTPPYARRDTVDLDRKGEKAMPVPCIVCHGGRADPLLPDGQFPRRGDTKSHLQALDVGSFEFSAQSPWTQAEVEPGLKTVNQAVYESYAVSQTPANGDWVSLMAREMLESWYGGPGLPGNFSDSYVPLGWQPDPSTGAVPAGADALYRDLLSTNCRTCHLLRGSNHQSDIDFTSYAKFISHSALIQELVYDKGQMPLARITFDNVAEESGLLEQLASFLPGFSRMESDGSLMQPGRSIAKAGPDRRGPSPMVVNGAASLFPESFAWSILSTPDGASASLAGATTERAMLTADTPGAYLLELTAGEGATDTVTVVVDDTLNPAPRAISFNTHIKPILQSDCAGCHSADNTDLAPPVFYTDPLPGENRDLYREVRARVDFLEPENSRLLLKPSDHHHFGGLRPGFNFDGDRSRYDLFLNWILEGAREG